MANLKSEPLRGVGSQASLRTVQERAKQRIGTLLKDKWQLDALLGVGGNAAVYAATHRNGKHAAIKILHRELSTNADIVTRFLREGYAANRLEHPGAVSILDDDLDEDGSVFLVMELLDGYSLDRFTRGAGSPMPVEQLVRIGDDVLEVLSTAHAKGVIHRDIKPANLFLTRDGKLKVLDFGIARLAQELTGDPSSTQTGAAIGTPAFMPPEQARGRWTDVDARTDLWAVGATLYALATGRRPRRAATVNEELLLAMTEPLPPLASVAPQIPPDVCAVIDRACAFEMNARWPTAQAMQLALRSAAATLHTGPHTPAALLDTARVLNGVESLDAALNTSRPTVDPSLPLPTAATEKRHVGTAIGVFLAVLAVGIGGALVFMRLQTTKAAAVHEDAVRVEPAAPHPPLSETNASGPTANPPATTTSNAPAASATMDLTNPVPQKPITTRPAPAKSAHASPTASANPFDSRF